MLLLIQKYIKIRFLYVFVMGTCFGYRTKMVGFSDIFEKEDKFCDFLFAFLYIKPQVKMGLLLTEKCKGS